MIKLSLNENPTWVELKQPKKSQVNLELKFNIIKLSLTRHHLLALSSITAQSEREPENIFWFLYDLIKLTSQLYFDWHPDLHQCNVLIVS